MLRVGSSRRWRLLFTAGDVLIALAAWWAAIQLRVHFPVPLTRDLLPPDRVSFGEGTVLFVVTLELLALYFFGLYDSLEPLPRMQLAWRLARAGVLQLLGLTAYFFLADTLFPRSIVILYSLVDIAFLLAWRVLLQRLVRPGRRRVLIVGDGAEAIELAGAIATHHWHGLEVSGHVSISGRTSSESHPPELGPRLGTLEEVPMLLDRGLFDELVLAPPARSWQTRLIGDLAAQTSSRPSVLLLPGPYESMVGRMRYRWVNDIPLIEVVRPSEWSLHRPVKRLMDLVAGSMLVVLTLPLMIGCAVVIRLSSGSPVFYRQERVGRRQRRFTLLKFRTMTVGAETAGEVLAREGDPRATRIGALMRSSRLDELPQLFNVLTGSMSLVGPRPERPGFAQQYLEEVPGYAERFSLAPGITGLAQVNGDYHSSPENKLRYDLAYVANWSLWLDLSILFRTIRIILSSRGV